MKRKRRRPRYQKGTPEQERSRDLIRYFSLNRMPITPGEARQLYAQAGWPEPAGLTLPPPLPMTKEQFEAAERELFGI